MSRHPVSSLTAQFSSLEDPRTDHTKLHELGDILIIATVAYYGPDDQFASKVAAGIILHEGRDVAALERWYSEDLDVRYDPTINEEIVEFIDRHEVRSVIMTDGLIGCPDEEGIDYPEGESCPECPYWTGRDRWTGKVLEEEAHQALKPAMAVGCA